MKIPFELTIGLTYTRAGRRGRRKDRFLSFISGMSVASIALGVAALIIVLSVMNGFQKEVRDRMLSVIPHVEIRASKGALTDVEEVEKVLKEQSDVDAVAPFLRAMSHVLLGQRRSRRDGQGHRSRDGTRRERHLAAP